MSNYGLLINGELVKSDMTLDVINPATDTKQEDIKRDVAISVNKLPDILGGSS